MQTLASDLENLYCLLSVLVNSISFNVLIQILASSRRQGDQQMNFCMHSCTFTRDSITPVTLHITCTVHPGLDIVGNKVVIQGLYHGFRDAILSHLVTMHQAPGASGSLVSSFLCNPYIHFLIYEIFYLLCLLSFFLLLL